MPKKRKQYPLEHWRRMVDLVRSGRLDPWRRFKFVRAHRAAFSVREESPSSFARKNARLFLATLVVAGSLSSDPLSGQVMLGARGGLFMGRESGGLEGGVFLERRLGWKETAVVLDAFVSAARIDRTSNDLGVALLFKAGTGGPRSIHLFLGPVVGRTRRPQPVDNKAFLGLRTGGGFAMQVGESSKLSVDVETFWGAGEAVSYSAAKLGVAFPVG